MGRRWRTAHGRHGSGFTLARWVAVACLAALLFPGPAAGAPSPYGALQTQESALATLDLQVVQARQQEAAVTQARAAAQQQLGALDRRQAALNADLTDGQGRVDAVVRFLYENGPVAFADVVFGSTSFTDFITRLGFIRTVIAYDVGVLRQVTAERRDLTATVAAARAEQSRLTAEASRLAAAVARLKGLEARHRAALANASSRVVAFDQALLKGLPGLEDLLARFTQMPWADVNPDHVRLDFARQEIDASVAASTLNAYFQAHVPDFSGFAFAFGAPGATLSGHGVSLSGQVSAVSGKLIWSPSALDVGGGPAPPAVLRGLLAGDRLAVDLSPPVSGFALSSATTGAGSLQLVFAP